MKVVKVILCNFFGSFLKPLDYHWA